MGLFAAGKIADHPGHDFGMTCRCETRVTALRRQTTPAAVTAEGSLADS